MWEEIFIGLIAANTIFLWSIHSKIVRAECQIEIMQRLCNVCLKNGTALYKALESKDVDTTEEND